MFEGSLLIPTPCSEPCLFLFCLCHPLVLPFSPFQLFLENLPSAERPLGSGVSPILSFPFHKHAHGGDAPPSHPITGCGMKEVTSAPHFANCKDFLSCKETCFIVCWWKKTRNLLALHDKANRTFLPDFSTPPTPYPVVCLPRLWFLSSPCPHSQGRLGQDTAAGTLRRACFSDLIISMGWPGAREVRAQTAVGGVRGGSQCKPPGPLGMGVPLAASQPSCRSPGHRISSRLGRPEDKMTRAEQLGFSTSPRLGPVIPCSGDVVVLSAVGCLAISLTTQYPEHSLLL